MRDTLHGLSALLLHCVCAVALSVGIGCEDERFDFDDPARGPSDLVGGPNKVSNGEFFGGNDELPEPRVVGDVPREEDNPDCGPSCADYCDSIEFQNPVNEGLCRSLWGVGLQHQPIVKAEACRRLFVDVLGRYPTRDDVVNTCDGKTWGEVAINLLLRDEFVLTNQKIWSDRLKYDTQAVSVERIYDMDSLVAKLYQGQISYDQFVAVTSAHPVLTRRYDTPEDRSEALYWIFMGRPPLGSELADMSRLYEVWWNGYYDHPDLQMRLPDAHIHFPCTDEDGMIDPVLKARCTSTLWGFNELILKPDIRARPDDDGRETIWSGILKADEWQKLQIPGRILARDQLFWEKAVDDVLLQYLDYDLGNLVPTVRDKLVRYFLEFNGDIRALHFAVLTSAAYLQSNTNNTQTRHRWTYGPMKQIDAEAWLDSIEHMTGYQLSTCDHRLTRPREFLESDSIAGVALVENSRWEFDEDGVDTSYRSLARNLGGCPDNSAGSRFKIVSILTTAQQLNFVNEVCDPAFEGGGASVQRLLPGGIEADATLTEDLGETIYQHQLGLFHSRVMTGEERDMARTYASECTGCTAAQFARPACFAMLSSSDMLFY